MKHDLIVCGYSRGGTTMFYNMLRGSLSGFNFHDREVSFSRTMGINSNQCTKRPLDFNLLGSINSYNKLSKEISVIIQIRDPRSLLCSFHKAVPDDYFQDGDFMYFIGAQNIKKNPGIIPTYNTINKMIDNLNQNNIKYYMLKYENLLTNPDQEQKGLSNTFNINFIDKFENFHKKDIPENLQGPLNGVREIDQSRLQPWKDPKHKSRIKQQFEKHPELFDILIDYGYEKDNSWFDDFR